MTIKIWKEKVMYTWRMDNIHTHAACRVRVSVFEDIDMDTLDRIGHMLYRLRRPKENGIAFIEEKGIFVGTIISRMDGKNLFIRQNTDETTILFLKRKKGE